MALMIIYGNHGVHGIKSISHLPSASRVSRLNILSKEFLIPVSRQGRKGFWKTISVTPFVPVA
jgi:hypothetical protein